MWPPGYSCTCTRVGSPMIGIWLTVSTDPMNGHERSAHPCAITTRSFGSVATATRKSVADADPENPPFREVRSQARATSFDTALYRASVFQPTVRVTKSAIAVVVGATILNRIGSFVSCVGFHGNGSYAVT